MMKLTRFLKELPGVRDRMTARDIKAGLIISEKAMEDLYTLNSARGPVTLIGPDAGQEVYDLYQSGQLPMKEFASIGPAPLIEKYLAERDEFADEILLRREIRDKARNPNSLTQEDLENWHILEHVFRDAVGEEEGLIPIAGKMVAKKHSGRPGKPTGADYSFHWKADDGDTRVVKFSLLQPTKRGYGDPRKAS